MICGVHDERWLNALERLPQDQRDVYFLPAYGNLYADSGTRCESFIFEEQGEVFLFPYLISEIKNRPGFFDVSTAYGYGGPVSSCEDPQFLTRASSQLKNAFLEKNVVAQLIRFHPLLDNQSLLSSLTDLKITPICPTVFVDLTVGEEKRWQEIYSHANRKQINKSKRQGLSISFDGPTNAPAWARFQTLYAETMKQNQAKDFYFFSEKYFEGMRATLSHNIVLANVIFEREIIASMIVLFGPQFAHCHLIGSTPESFKLGATNFVHHELIQWAKSRGCSKLHIGGGRTNSMEDSLLNFKRNFSDQISTFHVGEQILNSAVYSELIAQWESKFPGVQDGRLLKYRDL